MRDITKNYVVSRTQYYNAPSRTSRKMEFINSINSLNWHHLLDLPDLRNNLIDDLASLQAIRHDIVLSDKVNNDIELAIANAREILKLQI